MNTVRYALAGCLLLGAVTAKSDPLTLTCPEAKTVPCNQLENLEITGEAVASGGCGDLLLLYRDSTLAPDSLVLRIWSVADSCGGSQVCFQSITLTASMSHVAVLPLENLSTAEEGARVLQRLLEDAMSESDLWMTVSPAKVDDAIMRGRVRQPVLMDDTQRKKLSLELDAQYFIVGSLLNYEVFQDQYSGPIPMVSCALQLQRASDGKVVWSESLHAVGNDGEWLFALGVEHDITRLARNLAKKAASEVSKYLGDEPCTTGH
jgi:hypothetical protein